MNGGMRSTLYSNITLALLRLWLAIRRFSSYTYCGGRLDSGIVYSLSGFELSYTLLDWVFLIFAVNVILGDQG
jgi:hypothetical protein